MPDHQPVRFGFTKLLVTDLDKSSAFYQQVFGLKESQRIQSDIAGRPIEEIMFRPMSEGAATFVLLRYLDATAPSSDEVILGFLTSDVEALLARAVAAGGRVVRPPLDAPQHGVKVAFLSDLEGHLVEVVEPTG